MRRLLCCLLCLSLLTVTACSDKKKAQVNAKGEVSKVDASVAEGNWVASYDETFDYKPLYAEDSPYSAEGENLIKSPSFDGVTVAKGGALAADQWSEQGVWSGAYTVESGIGVDNSAALRFHQAEDGESQTVVKYLLNVESNTRYVLSAKLKTVNLSKPAIRVSGFAGYKLLGQTAGGYDDFWEEVSFTFFTGDETQVVITFLGNSEDTFYTNCLSGTSYLDDLCVYKTSGKEVDALPSGYRLDSAYDYDKWSGQSPSGWKWGLSEFWWYSNARVFSYNAVPTVYSPDSRCIYVSGRPKAEKVGYFGLEFTWETKLEKGYGYQFAIKIPFGGETPDIITVNDKIVWAEAYDNTQTYAYEVFKYDNAIMFEYVAQEDEYARIRFICETGIERGESKSCSRRIFPPPNGDWSTTHILCRRTALMNVPKYTKYDLHKDTEFQKCSETDAAKMLKTAVTESVDIDSIAGVPKVDYKVSDMTVYELCLNIMFDDCVEAIKKLGIDTLTYIPQSKKGDTNFEEWAKRATGAGIKHMKLYTVMPKNDKGDYEFTQLITMIKESPESVVKGINATTKLANRWLELVPDGRVTICFCEMESWFGMWDKGIENSALASVSGYESVKLGGIDAYYTVQQYLKNINSTVMSKVSDKDKVNIMYNSSRAGFDLTNLVKTGTDLIYNKGTNRANYNITVAAARGAGNSFDLPFGVGWDTYDRDYWYGYSNKAVLTGFLSIFHGGVDGIFNEIKVTNDTEKKVSAQGAAWIDGIRYAKTHPGVGEPVVDIGILRGEGDEWYRLTAISSAWEQSAYVSSQEMNRAFKMENVPTKWAAAARVNAKGESVKVSDTYLSDFNLLNVIFTDYCDDGGRTKLQSVFTGTPYGAANIISDTTSLDKLMQYKTLVYCGRGQTISSQTVKKLEDYVKKGGNLVIAVGQLKDENSSLVVDSFAGIKLGKSKIVDSLPYTYIEGGSDAKTVKVIERHKNGDPQALYAEFGKGSVSLFSGEYLAAFDSDVTREVMASYFESNTAVSFSKKADYIEYTPNIKGKSVVIPFINQGRGLYPSGNGTDHGVYNGNVAVKLDRFGLDPENIEVFRVLQSIDGTMPVELTEVDFKVEDDTVIFNINVALLDEIVIGPKGQASKDFFS